MKTKSRESTHKSDFITAALGVVVTLVGMGMFAGCAVPIPQMKSVSNTHNGNIGSKPPALKEWHEKYPLKVVLVHGMGEHPFGITNPIWEPVSPNLLKENSYTDLHSALLHRYDTDAALRQAVATAAVTSQYHSFIAECARKAKLKEVGSPTVELIRSESGRRVLGYVLKRSFEPLNPSEGKPVDFYCICWSVYLSMVKEQTYGAWSGKEPVGKVGEFEKNIDGPRHSFNRALKHSLVDWGLTDASLYVGNLGDDLEHCVGLGLARMAVDLDKCGNDHVVIVTSSLGSTITYNALKKIMSGEGISGEEHFLPLTTAENGRATTGTTKLQMLVKQCPQGAPAPIAFYMFANQYGLLASANEIAGAPKSSASTSVAQPKLQANPVTTLEQALGKRTVQLVAFTDPDDLLSFGLPGKNDSPVKVRNVYLNNNQFGLAVLVGPIPIGTVTNPLAAHVGYEKNLRVLDTMWEGLPLIK